MRLAHHRLARLGAMLALSAAFSAASSAAFAQSTEFRRGYEEGYAAGLRAAGEDRGRGQGGGRRFNEIRIEQAEYGARGAMCDARRAVRQEAERNGGAVVAGNHLCGDPAYRVSKRLSVVYRCGDGQPQHASARENDTVHLNCRR